MWQWETPPEDGEHRAALPLDHVVRPGERLRYAVLAAFDPEVPVTEAYRSTAVALDLVTDDGARLSGSGAVDQHGVLLDPGVQGASRTVAADQWTVKTVDLAPLVGQRLTAVDVRTVGVRGRTLTGWLGDLRIEPAPPVPEDPVDQVRTTRGTRSTFLASRGNTAPLVAVPHGGVFGTPRTDARERRWIYRWSADDRDDGRPALQALATSHIPSPWMGDHGVLQVMPSAAADPDPDPAARALGFDHDQEVDRPHRWSAELDGGVRAELTAGRWTLVMRFRFPDDTGWLVLDQVDEHGGLDLDGGIAAFVDGEDDAPRMFAVVDLDRPVLETRRWGPTTGAVRVDLGPDRTVEVRIGTSFLGLEQARRNAAAEADGFDAVAARARAAWSERLGAIRVEGGSPDRLTTLYSNLYRLFLYPNEAAEETEDGLAYASPFHPLERPHTPERTGCRVVRGARLTVNHGFWDTYRTVWPLLGMLRPDDAGALLDGFLQHYRDAGWTSRWSAPGARDVMTGTSTDVVFADAVLAGLPHLDALTAYDSALVNASVPSPDPATGRKGVRGQTFRGFTDTSTPEGMSWTLDAAICDAAIAVLAEQLQQRLPADHPRRGDLEADRQWFAARGARWAQVFDERIGFFQGRRPDGTWRVPDAAEYDPRVWGGDYTETNGWGTAFTAPHDGAGLATLHGGPAALAERLGRFLAEAETGDERFAGAYGGVIHEMREARDCRSGMLALSNQPAHHIPFMHAFTGMHAETQRIVRDALDRLFVGSEAGQGYPGDEDDGELSAWWILAALGLYPLVPASGELVLTAPLFPDASVTVGDGATLRIRTTGSGPHIASALIDGEPWDRVTVPRDRLVRGAELEIALAEHPTGWASGTTPSSLTPPGARPRQRLDLTAPGAGPAFDDVGGTVQPLDVGGSVGYRFPGSVRTGLYTVTADQEASGSWRLEGRVGDRWRLLDERAGAPWVRQGQTRPFLVAEPVACAAYRLVATAPLRLLQLELLADD